MKSIEKKAEPTEQNSDFAHLGREKTVSAGTSDRLSEQDELSLVHRLRHGDRKAAEALVEAYYERIYLYMRATGHDGSTSEDLTQETFMKVWRHIGQLRDGHALTAWLFRIAGNISRQHWRKHRRGTVSMETIPMPEDKTDGLLKAGDREYFARLHEAVARLPWKLREVIVLHYLEQLTIAEAAEAAQIRQGTLKSRLSRALDALRAEIADTER